MSQPAITLTAGGVTVVLDPDLEWLDEFEWASVEQTAERSVSGALIIDVASKIKGRPITLAPPDDSAAWMLRSTLITLQAWEANPNLTMSLSLRGELYAVNFRRFDGAPIEAHPTTFVANPLPGGIGDWYLTTIRLIEV